jgi:peptidyl-prolyl cis-trans isomerase D
MLKILRDNLRYLSWILWLVIIVFVAFVFVDFGGARMGGDATGAAATVGDREVSYVEYQRQYRTLEDRYRQTLGERFTPEMARQMRLPAQALEQVVAEKILLREAERAGLTVSDEEVRKAILEVPAFGDERGNFVGQEYYQQILQAEGYTTASFERSVREQILVNKLSAILAQTLHVPDSEVERSYREQAETARIRYAYLPANRFQGRVTTTPAELQAYFAAHPGEFQLPNQRSVGYLLVDSALLRAQAKVEDAEVAKYYEEHPDEFRQEEQVRARHILLQVGEARSDAQARTEIEAIRQQIAGGADFAKLAAERSDDPGSKGRGGDLGLFGRGRMIKEFEDAAFGGEPGKLLGPIRTSFGYHLLEVTERRPAGERPFAEVQGAIRNRLLAERVESAAEARSKQLAAKVKADKIASEEGLKALADADVVSWQVTAPFGEEDAVPGVGRGTPFTAAAFALAKGTVSDPVKIPRGWALLWLVEERAARDPQLAEVEAKVRAAVEREKQSALAKTELERVRAAMGAGGSLDEAVKELGIEVRESASFGARGGVAGLPGSEPVAQAALALGPGQVGGPLAIGSGAVLFQVTERTRFDPVKFAAEKTQTRSELESREFQALLESLITQRKLELKVTYDRRLVEELGLSDPSATS